MFVPNSVQGKKGKAVKPIKKTRLSEAAIEQIKGLIVRKDMQPGDKLPSERYLVEALNISRTSIREALRMLEIMGLVEVKPGKGVYVKELTGDLFFPLSSWLSTHRETLYHHFEARLVLEPAAAALAAKRAREEDIKALEKAMKTFEETLEEDDIVGFIRADIEFHRLIAEATNNKTIQLVMNAIARYSFEGWKASLRTEGRAQQTPGEHRKLLNAIIAGDDKGAQRAMRNHLKAAIKNLKKAGLE